MVLSCFMFGACSELGGPGDDGLEEDYPEITIYSIMEKGTTETAIKKVEEALSEISIRKCGVKINLVLMEEKDYAPVLFSKVASEMSRYNTDVNKTAVSATDKVLQVLKDVDYSKYEGFRAATDISSEVANAKLDIFLVYNPKADSPVLDPKDSEAYNPVMANGGMFKILYEQRALIGLTSKFNSGYSALKTSAYPEALEAVTLETYESAINENPNKVVKEDIYAIPNNIVYGGYEFIIFDDKYIADFWSEDRKKDDLVAVKDDGSDSDSLAALIKELKASKAAGDIADNVEITKTFASYTEFNEYVRDGGEFCIGFINGDISVKELCAKSGEYEIYTRKVNKISNLDLCESMFCISPSTKYAAGGKMDETRLNQALEVLTLLNTDKDFRNIFQYGVRDTHYTLGRDGVAHISGTVSDRYVMNHLYTGNNFIIHPSDRMDDVTIELAMNKWTLGKKQVKEVLEEFLKKA